MKVLLWQRKLSEVCQYLITQTGTLYRSSMVEHVTVNHRVAGSSPAGGTKLNVMSGKDYKFLYWDDFEDSKDEAEKRMQIIMRNGNSGEHYDIYDDGEEQDVE